MTIKLILDKAGRIVIPKVLRKELHLSPGDALQLDTMGEQLTLRPVRAEVPIRKEDGVWVFRAGLKINVSIRKVIGEGRDERHLSILGRNESSHQTGSAGPPRMARRRCDRAVSERVHSQHRL